MLLYLVAGYPWTRLIRKMTSIERFSLAFLVGAGLSTFVWFLLNRLGLGFDISSLVLSVALTGSLGWLLTHKNKGMDYSPKGSFSTLEKSLLGVTLLLILLAVIVSSYNPITAWDAVTLYDYRGLVIAGTHSLASIETGSYYLSYPLMTSLTHASVYLLKGDNPQTFYALLYAALLGIIYGRMSVWTNRRYALITTLLVAGNPFMWQHATIAYTNLPYAAFLVAGLFYAPSSILLSGLLLGLSIWTRNTEPFWLAGLLLIGYYAWKEKQFVQAAIATLVTLVFQFAWSIYVSGVSIRSQVAMTTNTHIYTLSIFGKMLKNTPMITHYLTEFIVSPYLGIWLVALASLIVAPTALIGAVWLIAAMVIGGVAVFSTYYASWYSIGGSATRMLLFIVPLVTVCGMLAQYKLKDIHAKK